MSHPPLPAPTRVRQAGFTLTELMVAITGGLFLAVAVFALARDSTRFFRQEARAGDATLGAVVGFQRLQADIQRAGYMASPNINRDTQPGGNVCVPSGGTSPWPAQLKEMGSIRVTDADMTSFPAVFTDAVHNATTGPDGNGALALDVLTIAGNFSATNRFWVKAVDDIGADYQVTFQENGGPLSRMGFADLGAGGAGGLSNADKDAIMKELFPPDRVLRLVDQDDGKESYGVIKSSGFGGDGPYVMLDGTVPISRAETDSSPCAVKGTGARANVVNFIRYEIIPATASSGAGGAPPVVANNELDVFEQTRTDLWRYEVDAYGSPIDGTRELIAEYAVDLRFGVGVIPAPGATLTMFDERNRNARETYTGKRTFSAGGNLADIGSPESIVLVRARLSVRSQMPDRYGGVPAGAGIGSGFYRMFLGEQPVPGSSQKREHWARVRTLQADISLRNTRDKT